MWCITGEVKKNSFATFYVGRLHMDAPVLADQQILTNINSDTECSLEDLLRVIADKDGRTDSERESGNSK